MKGKEMTVGELREFLKQFPVDTPVELRLFKGDWAVRCEPEVEMEDGVVIIDEGNELP